MSATSHWWVNCTASPRSDECWWKTEDVDTRGTAQRLARKDGWIVGDRGEDNICPSCRKELGL